MEEGTIVKWRKQEGEYVKAGEVLIEIATDKATVEHSALDPGFVRKILIKEGQSAFVNQPLAVFTLKEEESIDGYVPEGEVPKKIEAPAPVIQEKAAVVAPKVQPTAMNQPQFIPEPPLEDYTFPSPDGEDRIVASPLAKKIAKEKGIDLSTVKGSGPHGRIVVEDLAMGQPNTVVAFGRRTLPTLAPGTYEEEPLSPIRKVIGRRLQESKTFIPHFYVTQEVDASALVRVREELAQGGIKVSFNDFILRAVALSLREHPSVNSGFNSVTQSIIRFKTVDISVAVSVPAGLITPIVRHADYKNLGQLSLEVKQLAKRAKEGSLEREEYTGGSFTISNLGMYGISEFSAIINPPQAAILAVGGIEDRPVIKEGKVVPGKIIRLTVSADHRVIDGADVAKFLKSVQRYLENPSILLV
jgi:pyruvate dehydrogenase E2 component (dihydrolipoamide acetyltransferase)